MPRIPKLTKFELITLGRYIDEYGAEGRYLTTSYETKYVYDLIRKGYLQVIIADADGKPMRVKPTILAFEVYSNEKKKWGKLDADSAEIRDRSRRADKAREKARQKAKELK